MSEVDWSDLEELPPKLTHYGKNFRKRFMDPRCSLYKEQKEALQSLVKWFSRKETRDFTAVVVMPTGSGKTGVICCLPYTIGGAIEDEEIAEGEIDLNKSILMITPSLTILQQLKKDLSKDEGFLRKRGILKEKELQGNAYYTVRTMENSKAVTALEGQEADIILSNSQKWRKKKDHTPTYSDLRPDLFSMVIVDEAHHLPASQWEEIVNQFRECAKIVFFTATPDRADGKEITTDGAINAKGYTYELTRQSAIQERLIRETKLHNLPFESDERQDFVWPSLKRARSSGSSNQHEEASPLTSRKDIQGQFRLEYAKEVLEKVKERLEFKNRKQPLPGGKKHTAIVIAKNIAEAYAVSDLCTEIGFHQDRVKVMHSSEQKKPSEKEEAIQEIRNGSIEIVIIVKMLLEGFDHPPLSIAAIVTSIRSPVKFAQFIGRVQRLVSYNDQDGNVKWEDDIIKADIITHQYFEQKLLYEEYRVPQIKDTENQLLDEDDNDKDDLAGVKQDYEN